MKSQRCWFLAPRACPLNGPIKLGNIIVSPAEPDDPLLALPGPLPPSETVSDFAEANFRFGHGMQRSIRVGVWASFLQQLLAIPASADVSVAHGRSGDYTLAAREMRTRHFIPSGGFLDSCVQQAAVSSFVRKTRFGRKLYMVTGVMTAAGATSCATSRREHGVEMNVGVDATAMGVPISGGPSVDFTSSENDGIQSEAVDDFVFAFRLKQLKIKKGEVVGRRDFQKGALFEENESANLYEELQAQENLMPIDVEGLVEGDVTGEMVGMDTIDALEELSGEDCLCVMSEPE